MELYIASAVVGLGYMLSSKSGDKKISKRMSNIPAKSVPNGDNIFNSNRVKDIRLSEQVVSNNNYNKVFDKKKTNMVIPGPTEALFNKVDYIDKDLPIEFNNIPSNSHSNKNPNVGKKWYGVSLTGEPINPNNFTHNNMTPFFGSHVRQNVDEYSNQNIVSLFTGQMNFDKKKTEIPHMFNPESNISNPYGMSNLSGYQRERYIVSNKRNNEAPTEKIYVGPGLNKGYTSCPSGGFQQAETRDYILPKTVDELRVKTNPKLTYNAPVISGSKPSRPGKIGVVQKNRPDSFAVWSPDRYFVTTGDRCKPKQRAEVVLRHSNRTTTDVRRAIGPAGPSEGRSKKGIRSNIRVSEKSQYTPGGPRGIDGAGKWSIPEDCPNELGNYVPMKECDTTGYPTTNQVTGMRNKNPCYTDNRNNSSSIHDYGKGGLCLSKTNREETSFIPNSNLVGFDRKGYVPITSDLRPTRKEDVVGNARWASNVQSSKTNGVVWDPENIAKTTIKETLLQEAPFANMSAQKPSNLPVYDSDDLLRTTNKETTITDYSGNAYFPNEDRRYCNKYELSNTNRQFTSDNQYIGNPEGDIEGAYQIAEIDPKITNRQYTSNNSHVGNAGNAENKPRETKCMMDNVVTRSLREKLSKGRVPAREGPKDITHPENINATTSKFGDLQNTAYSQRDKMSTKVYNSLPQANECSKTKNKKTISNVPIRNRLDSRLLDEYRKNPYTQSLESHWNY